ELPALLAALERADLACGVRMHRNDPPSRRLASALANLGRRLLFAPRVRDLACPLRVFRAQALARVEEETPLFDGAHRWLPVLFTYDLVRVLAGRRRALLAAAVLATAPIVLAYARLVIFDMPLTALVTAALDCLVRARTEGNAWRWLPLAGLAMGLATLTKGPVGIAVPLLAWFAARGAL